MIGINDLRADKGGDPDRYRRLLLPDDGDLINQVLTHDNQRRSILTSLESLRSQSSNLQKNVLLQRKRREEVPSDVLEQLKEWKAEMATLSNQLKGVERERDDTLLKINDIIEANSSGSTISTDADTSVNTNATENTSSISITNTLEQETSTDINNNNSLFYLQNKSKPYHRTNSQYQCGVLGMSIQSSRDYVGSWIFAFLLPLPEQLRGEQQTISNSNASSDINESESNSGDKKKKKKKSGSNNSRGVGGSNSSNSNLDQKYDLLQVTLVDCPGHASLIRTIIGGAQIIDMVLLVVDATKGMQTQTAECLVIAEMTTRNLIVVLNKIDMFPENEREERGPQFEDAKMVGISACVGGEKVAAVGDGGMLIGGGTGSVTTTNAHGEVAGTNNIHGLLDVLQSQMRAPNRDARPSPERFHFAVDHCFPIKGQGTKKIKGLQMFRRKANIIQQGDRAGICVSNFDAKLMERGTIASPGTIKLIHGAIAVVRKMASNGNAPILGKSSLGGTADLAGLPRLKFDWNQDFLHQDNYLESIPVSDDVLTSQVVETSKDVYCPMDSLVIGSRLDTEVNANACRLAFSGRLVERYDERQDNGRLKSYTKKEKVGRCCRLGDPYRRSDDNKLVRYEIFGTDLFKKETNMSQFVGLLIETDSGDVGSIQSSFGSSGKFRVHFPAGTGLKEGDSLYLRFKRYANDPRKAIHQDGTLLRLELKKKKNGSNNADEQSSTKNGAVGEIEKLKGDILENGKSSMAIVSGLFTMADDISKHKGRKVVAVTTEEEGSIHGSFGKMGKVKVSFENGVSAEVGGRVKMLAA
ncbi:selenocysteine-specific elongation factor [Skeletonema marinoi]|uniref:Elongation factor Tu, chloroplastic n=1 Tax=Skeletonema marinoi TaxID=267567 RepID=A0AAD8YLY8_9STRA|nr:selenocysteine-specific elongation factor [Skeletonema marinoi]